MYVIAGATGNTGSVAATTLLQRGAKVRALVRDPQRGERLRALGAELAVGSVLDPVALSKAFAGARGAYLLVPPDLGTPEPLARGRAIVDAWLAALHSSGVEHVVVLSSIGAQHVEGTGPIKMLHLAERALHAQAIPATFVRAAYFVENWGSALGPAENEGILPSFHQPDVAFSMVATRDIGEMVAEALLDPARRHRVIELAGPSDASPNDVAAILGRILGRDLRTVHVAGDAIVTTLQSFGVSAAVAEQFREMAEALDSGHIAFEHPGSVIRGRTSIESVLRAMLGRS
ncbi:MAG: NmrA family NAD(P)-binding protein [Deltaproteobacteria bacterium]|nr:NmrA family NAD(P)-binding protein [Deltaproteobacteria bacterium]